MSSLSTEILSRRQSSEDYLSKKRDLWDKIEQLVHNQLNDNTSLKSKSRVFDPKLSSFLLERSFRVMAQIQTGKVVGISKNDIGDAKLKNLLLDKYILPNANSQFDFLTKMRMVDFYSNLYGSFYTLTDWNVGKNGYIGPDVWLLNIRDVYPQMGAISVYDSDHIIIRTWRPLSWFEGLKKQDGFKNIDKIVTSLKQKAGSKQNRDSSNISKREEDQYTNESPSKGQGYYEVLTQYEGDRWVDMCVDADMEFRDAKNPHGNGELPVDCKYSIPLLDDFMGMGDGERGASMQMTINANWQLYMDAFKKVVDPPLAINKDMVVSDSSIRRLAGANWLFRAGANGSVAGAVQPITLNPAAMSNFNNLYQVANAALLNMFGTTDTSTTSQTDPGMGKTPQALELQSMRQNTRDDADRFFMEQYLTKLMKRFVNLMNKKQSGEVAVRMFKPEIDSLAKDYPEIAENYDESEGKLYIKHNKSSNIYDYEIVSGSTYAMDHQAQQKNLQTFLDLYMKSQTPQGNILVNDLKNSGYELNFGELFKRVISKSGIQDWDKILVEMSQEEKDQMTLNKDASTFNQVLQQIQGNTNMVPAVPPQEDMSQIG